MRFPADKILIVFALEQEAQGWFAGLRVLYCGVGKVNAAYRLTQALAEYKTRQGEAPALVLNLGSAGSTRFNHDTVINCTQFIQRDFDVTALGCDPYTTPFDDTPSRLSNGLRYDDLPEGICGTGDQFITQEGETPWNVIDMEAFALAKICHHEKAPFACFKYITDGADGQAATAWQDNLKHTAARLHSIVKSLTA